MDEDRFNIELRKFLKQVGVTSQREIEKAVQAALDDGRLKGGETLRAQIRLTIDEIGLVHQIDDTISLE
ncbi:MAG TPA: DUF6494 family protein [Alphaproteobacteria bacterium]|nr:DUF6494 family protein [Alphaproteobacteria bacterium]